MSEEQESEAMKDAQAKHAMEHHRWECRCVDCTRAKTGMAGWPNFDSNMEPRHD